MSQERFGETTRRAFLGTATVATAASLTAPGAGEAQGVGTGNPAGATKLAQAECGCSRTAGGACKRGRLDKAGGYGNP